MLLVSNREYGLGKSHLVCAVIHKVLASWEPAYITPLWNNGRIISNPCPAYFTTGPALRDRIQATFNNDKGETEAEVYKDVLSRKLLVIDDVGKVRPRDLAFLQGVYFRVIDSRYVNERPLVLTSNLDYPELSMVATRPSKSHPQVSHFIVCFFHSIECPCGLIAWDSFTMSPFMFASFVLNLLLLLAPVT